MSVLAYDAVVLDAANDSVDVGSILAKELVNGWACKADVAHVAQHVDAWAAASDFLTNATDAEVLAWVWRVTDCTRWATPGIDFPLKRIPHNVASRNRTRHSACYGPPSDTLMCRMAADYVTSVVTHARAFAKYHAVARVWRLFREYKSPYSLVSRQREHTLDTYQQGLLQIVLSTQVESNMRHEQIQRAWLKRKADLPRSGMDITTAVQVIQRAWRRRRAISVLIAKLRSLCEER